MLCALKMRTFEHEPMNVDRAGGVKLRDGMDFGSFLDYVEILRGHRCYSWFTEGQQARFK